MAPGPEFWSIAETTRALAIGETTAVKLVDAAMRRIDSTSSFAAAGNPASIE